MKRIPIIHSQIIAKWILFISGLGSLIYLCWWFLPGHASQPYLYGLLVLGEIYHVGMALSFWHTLWPGQKIIQADFQAQSIKPSVDIFITVAGEPVDIVEATALAAKSINYPNKQIYLLNDGYVAKKDNWQEIESLAKRLQIKYITRKTPGGAKAGNINHALAKTHGTLIAIFDADMVAHPDFLTKTVWAFGDPQLAFVQTPQFYQNYLDNMITGGAWEQQELFFGPIMQGKDKSNASFICGTNVVIRRQALEQVGGMDEKNIAEDFLTSQMIHRRGWTSLYIREVLAEGLAPQDLLSYYKQQLRWARGSLETLFKYNPLFSSLSWSQKLEYLSSGLFYLNGLIVLIDIVMPLLFLYFGWQPVLSSTTNFAVFFIPFVFCSLVILSTISAGFFSFRAMAFTHSSWVIHLQALFSVLLNQKMGFSVTPKRAQTGNFLSLAYPHIAYTVLLLIGIVISTGREGISPAVATNIAWGSFNVIFFLPFIAASYRWSKLFNLGGRWHAITS